MNWFFDTIGSSIGKKLLMALTGIAFCMFIVVHLVGNLMIYGGKDFFNAYVETLHSLGPLIPIAEWGLLILAIIHVVFGGILYWGNFTARPVAYSVKKSGGGRTLGSATQAYTGLFILIFISIHLFDFHFADKTTQTVFQIVSNTFNRPIYSFFYILAMIVVAVHISHGFWSAFQTLGANQPKYMPLIRAVGIIFSLVVGIGFGFIPIYISFMA